VKVKQTEGLKTESQTVIKKTEHQTFFFGLGLGDVRLDMLEKACFFQ
jgi:hypothetical protein